MPIGVYTRTKEYRAKVGDFFRGKKLTQEHKDKIKKNHARPWLGKTRVVTEEHRANLSKALKGRVFTEEWKNNMSKAGKGKPGPMKGRKLPKEWCKNLSISHKGQKSWNKGKSAKEDNRIASGSRQGNWKGGVTPESTKIRNSIEFSLWRESVFARDNWTCQKSKIKGCKLHAHHIKNFSQHPELRFAIDNGITLSKDEHYKFHKIYGKQNNTQEQLDEFLSMKKDNGIE